MSVSVRVCVRASLVSLQVDIWAEYDSTGGIEMTNEVFFPVLKLLRDQQNLVRLYFDKKGQESVPLG